MILVHVRNSAGRACLGYIFSILTSLAYGGVMDNLGTIVVLPGCDDVVVVSRLLGAPPSERSVSIVYLGPVIV